MSSVVTLVGGPFDRRNVLAVNPGDTLRFRLPSRPRPVMLRENARPEPDLGVIHEYRRSAPGSHVFIWVEPPDPDRTRLPPVGDYGWAT